MAQRRLGSGAAVGLAVGAVFGLADGALARRASLSVGWELLPWGVVVDGAVGMIAGALIGAVLRVSEDRVPFAAFAAAALALVAGLGLAGGAPAPVSHAPRSVVGDARDVLWVVVDALPPEGLASLPRASTWAEDAFSIPRMFSASPDPRATWSAVMSLRLPPGRSTDAPRVPDVARWAGYRALAVFADDDAARVDDTSGWTGWVALPARSPWPRPLARLVPGRWLAPTAPAAPEDAVEAARALLGAGDGRWWLVVELPTGTPAQMDDALADLRELAVAHDSGHGVVVALSSLRGPGAPGLDAAGSGASAWVALPGGEERGLMLRLPFGSVDLAPTLHALATDRPYPPVSDALFYDPDNVKGWLRPALAASAGPVGRATTACTAFYGEGFQSAVSTEGDVRVFRTGGYALRERPDGRSLYDDLADPYWTHDLLHDDAPTCFGLSASALADRMAALLAERLALSAEGRDRVLDPSAPAFPLPRGDYPDPAAVAWPDDLR